MKKKRVMCYVAGTSGGHIIPCLTLAEEETEKNKDTEILFFTGNTELDKHIMADYKKSLTHVMLPLAKKKKGIFGIIRLGFNVIASMCKLFYYLIKNRPERMICSGGYIAIPATVCARILAIPVEIFELNAQPGKATCFLASWAVSLRICFAETQRYFPRKKCIKTAYPIRFFGSFQQMSKAEATKLLNLDPEKKTVTVLGGSQGSLEINNVIRETLLHQPDLHKKLQIIHQTGDTDTFDWQKFYDTHDIPARVFKFCSDLAPHYAAADLIVCRSGSGTLHEVLFFNKPCITVPLITPTNDHQLYNARAMQQEFPELFTMFLPTQDKKLIPEFTAKLTE